MQRLLRPVTGPLRARYIYLSAVRLQSTLAILEQHHGKLNVSSLATVTAAKELGGSTTALIACSGAKTLAEQVAKTQGLDKVVYVDDTAYDHGLPESFASMVVENVKKGSYSHIVAGHTSFGKGVMPRVAALLDSQQISDIVRIEDSETFVRPVYAGSAILTVKSTDQIKVITLRNTAFAPAEAGDTSAEVVQGANPASESRVEWVSEDLAKSDRPELASAGKVVSGGRGLKSKEEFDRLMPPLADALGAAIGASRAAVDSGFADNSLQVGQTGKNVAPQLYLAVGISGAIQHLAGMKDSKVIACINNNPEAAIFEVADVGLDADLFDKVPELTEKLKSRAAA